MACNLYFQNHPTYDTKSGRLGPALLYVNFPHALNHLCQKQGQNAGKGIKPQVKPSLRAVPMSRDSINAR